MGMDCYIHKISGHKIKTLKEFEEFENCGNLDDDAIILSYRKAVWLDQFIRKEGVNGRNYDEVILTREDIEKFIKTFENIETSILNKKDFFQNNISLEISEVVKNFKVLLNEDFDNNTFYYESCY